MSTEHSSASAGNLAILQHKKQPIPPTETFSCAGLARHKCFREVFEGVLQSPLVPSRVRALWQTCWEGAACFSKFVCLEMPHVGDASQKGD